MTWQPTIWWRVVRDVPEPTRFDIWCETSDEQEARKAVGRAPYPARLERLWHVTLTEWRKA